jgi:hypothetical protein
MLTAALALSLTAALPINATAQDFGAMVQQQMNQMNQNIARGQQSINNMVQQRMQDPQVRSAYGQYIAQMRSRGQAGMDYRTYTYNYIYTRGFSNGGIAHARATEAGIQANEHTALMGLRGAEARRGAAQQNLHDTNFANRVEAGRGLMGQSTYNGPNGGQTVLPHTWQPNTSHVYQGNTYSVDASGQYYAHGTDGRWYPVNR